MGVKDFKSTFGTGDSPFLLRFIIFLLNIKSTLSESPHWILPVDLKL